MQNQLATALQQPATNPVANTTPQASSAVKMTNPMTKHLAELYSREENKSIPLFLETGDDRLVADWIRDAERVAESNDWTA